MKRWFAACFVALAVLGVVTPANAGTSYLTSPANTYPICTVFSTLTPDLWRGPVSSGCAGQMSATAYSYIGSQIGHDYFGTGSGPGYINPPIADVFRVRVVVTNKYGWFCVWDHYASGSIVRRSCN